MKIDLWKLKTFIRGLRLHTLLYIRGCACSHQVSLRAGRWDSNNRYQTGESRTSCLQLKLA